MTDFKLFIDVDGDGTVDEEYTQYLHSMEWSIGFLDEIENVAPLSAATICLDKLSGLVSGDLYGKQIKITSIDDGTVTRTMFSGWVRDVEDVYIDRQLLKLNCHGFEEPLYTQRVSIPIQIDQKAGSILQLIIDQVNFRQKTLGTTIILNDTVVGFLGGTLGTSSPITTSFDTGVNIFPYAGDRWDNAIAINIIKDIVQSDSGRFYTDRDGVITFKDKSSLITESVTEINSNSVINSTLKIGAQVYNASQITIAGRFVGSPDSVLFEIDEPLKIRPGKPRELRCRYRDSNKNPAGAIAVNELYPVTNYVGNQNELGTGFDFTDFLSIDIIAQDGNSTLVSMYHNLPYDVWLTKFEITGTPLSKSDPMTIEVIDYPETVKNGFRYIASAAPLISTVELAENIAEFALARRKLTDTIYTEVESDVGLDDNILSINILDNITIDSIKQKMFREKYEVSPNVFDQITLTTGYTWEIFGSLPFLLDSEITLLS